MSDLTIIYITANTISDYFANNIQNQLLEASKGIPIISVSKKPISFGTNLVVNTPIHHISIYKDALEGVKYAQTRYIAIAEDDTLYSPEHFKHRPTEGKFAYNISCWGIYTWVKPFILSHRVLGGRRNHNMLICERDLYIEAMEERFAKYPDLSKVDTNVWCEPGKYEDHLRVTVRDTEVFYTNPPNIMFSHDGGLSDKTLGHKKRLGELRAIEIPYWGTAEQVMKNYVRS